ncbi:MAG TPA: TonB-dependent receptor [Vicinamibacterales bacterium]|nr:TonB-dependent receptor [Vicinamibacterales bacterium]
MRNWFGILAVLAIVAPGSALAQGSPAVASAKVGTASVKGLVKDSSGASIPGALVRVVNESGSTVESVTDGEGVFAAASLAVGAYRVEASLDGFETAVRRVTLEANQVVDVDLTLAPAGITEGVVVTARRSEEVAQEVPIPLSVVSGRLMAESGAFNVNRLKEMIPTVQFYSTNPRNSSINIRGLGAPFGLTNDGIEPGVGLYIDGVFYARPASASLDFVDVERIEVLRGPQGTLFGKNTTAGAINVTTRKPTFRPESEFEVNYGSLDFVQAKASVSGRLFSEKVAGRLSFSGTQRDGTIANLKTGSIVNDLDNAGLRGSLLFVPTEKVVITAAVDHTRQRPQGYTQVVAGVAPTLRPANRQWAQIASDLNYAPPSYNAFDRVTDVDTALRSYQDLGGATFNVDFGLGSGRLTSTTSRRYWGWNPSNDRDFTGLPVTSVSAAPSNQVQWTQEVRWAGDLSRKVNLVVGGFGFHQSLDSDPSFRQEQGSAAARVLLAPSANAATPGLLDGYGYDQYVRFRNVSAALFGQVAWEVTSRLRLLPGLRFNYDQKSVIFDQQVYGGLQTTDPALVALQLSVLAPQNYAADVDDNNLSGQFTAAYKVTSKVNAYSTYSTSFKSVGLNLNGVPTDAVGRPVLSAATVKPEDVKHFEVGVKTEPFRNVTANVALYNTGIQDFQTQVVNASVGVLRGYLANAEEARVRGIEFDSSARVGRNVTFYGAAAYTDARYVSFTDAPPPLEETGGPQVKDVSGSVLPGISKWAVSFGGEYARDARVAGSQGQVFGAFDTSYRSDFSSSSSASRYLVVDGYSLVNARAGFRWNDGWSVTVWARNLLDKNYYELLTAAPGNSGLYVGQVGDERTVGLTLRFGFKKG